MYTHILISTDGSELAQKGVDHGLSLAKALGSKVTIITVIDPFPGSGGWLTANMDLEQYEIDTKKHVDNILSAVKMAADKMGLEVDTLHVINAWPAAAIINVAETQSCNLIVMASHGRRGVKRMLLGSQTAEVVSSSLVPVLVVR